MEDRVLSFGRLGRGWGGVGVGGVKKVPIFPLKSGFYGGSLAILRGDLAYPIIYPRVISVSYISGGIKIPPVDPGFREIIFWIFPRTPFSPYGKK